MITNRRRWPNGRLKGAKTLSLKHAALADLTLCEPWLTRKQLAVRSGYCTQWIREILSSPQVQTYLAARKAQLIDPIIRKRLLERLDSHRTL